MDIHVQYQPTAKELARASSLFLEKKPLFLYGVGFINLFIIFILGIMVLKLFVLGLNRNEWIATLGSSLWLFGRRPLNEWVLFRRMKSSKVVEKPITVDISFNGIVWSGKSLRPGQIAWDQIKYIMETKNGFILPNAFTKFLWLPFRGFQSEQDVITLREAFIEKRIVLREYKSWGC